MEYMYRLKSTLTQTELGIYEEDAAASFLQRLLDVIGNNVDVKKVLQTNEPGAFLFHVDMNGEQYKLMEISKLPLEREMMNKNGKKATKKQAIYMQLLGLHPECYRVVRDTPSVFELIHVKNGLTSTHEPRRK